MVLWRSEPVKVGPAEDARDMIYHIARLHVLFAHTTHSPPHSPQPYARKQSMKSAMVMTMGNISCHELVCLIQTRLGLR